MVAAVAILKILVGEGFSPRTEGKLVPLLSVFYKDTMWMYTFGAAFVANEIAEKIGKGIEKAFPFLTTNPGFEIPDFNISPRERKLLDRLCGTKQTRNIIPKSIRKLGFSEQDIKSYRHLMRFIPRYVETFF